jgi:2'-5' RNA ligase/ribosomal protein S18 acetylase RimI-like enzyme
VPKVRLGVALLVPPPVDREIDALRKAAGDGSLGRIPAHCTLVPPVNVRDDRMMDALDVVRAAAAATRPFTVGLGPPATFLPDNPVLQLPVSGDDVIALRDRVFREPLARPLTWPFVAHVTIADEMAPDRLSAGVSALADYRAEVTFDRVHVLQERPGRVWEPIADAAFAAPAVIGRGGLEVTITATDEPDLEARAFREREWPLFDVAEFGEVSVATPVALTARHGGAIVGLAVGNERGGVAHLSELIVAGASRGLGIGSHLLAAFESWAVARGARRLSLRTEAGSAAEAFYVARGWTVEARFSPWFHGRDFVQLRRDLR